MLGHHRRLGRGQVEHLPPQGLALRVGRRQRRRARVTTRRQVGLDPIRAVCLAQGRALVPPLPARALAGAAPLALRALLRRRLGWPVARRRLAAVAAVQPHSALQFLQALPQAGNLRLLALEGGPQLLVLGLQVLQAHVPARLSPLCLGLSRHALASACALATFLYIHVLSVCVNCVPTRSVCPQSCSPPDSSTIACQSPPSPAPVRLFCSATYAPLPAALVVATQPKPCTWAVTN